MAKFDFPTEVIDLPSKGKLYPESNPLSKGSVEIKYMTAKEEDILASQNLIKKGVVLDKLFESVVVDKDINMLTISSKGDAVKFGELTRRKSTHAGGSNSVRCIFAGGYMVFDTSVKEIDYITIASEGNAINFGELNTRRMSVTDGSAVNSTRFVLGGGHDYFPAGSSNGVTNSMEFITIASTGGGIDFGDLSSGQVVNRRACSDSHGGLGGY